MLVMVMVMLLTIADDDKCSFFMMLLLMEMIVFNAGAGTDDVVDKNVFDKYIVNRVVKVLNNRADDNAVDEVEDI